MTVRFDFEPNVKKHIQIVEPRDYWIPPTPLVKWDIIGEAEDNGIYDVSFYNLQTGKTTLFKNVESSDKTFTPTEPIPEGKYEIRIRIPNDTSIWSLEARYAVGEPDKISALNEEWETKRFRKHIAPLALSPHDIASPDTLEFKWECHDKDIQSYWVNIIDDESGKLLKTWSAIPAESNSFQVPLEFSATLGVNKKYAWFVKAVYSDEDLWTHRTTFELVENKDYESKQNHLSNIKEQRLSQNKRVYDRVKALTYEENLELRLEEIANKKTYLESFPTHSSIHLGHACNIDCNMCHSGLWTRQEKVEDHLIEDLCHYLPFMDSMVLTGGEPLIYPSFDKLVDTAEDYPYLHINVMSNGVPINKKRAERFCKGNFGQVIISIDAASEDVYDKIRLNSDWGRMLQALEYINEFRGNNKFPQLTINMTIQKMNHHQILDFFEMAQRYNIDHVNYNLMMTPNRWKWMEPEDVLMDPVLSAKVVDTWRELEIRSAETGIPVTNRVVTWIFNKYPELIRYIDELNYLPARQRGKWADQLGVDSSSIKILPKSKEKPIRKNNLPVRPKRPIAEPALVEGGKQLYSDPERFFCNVAFNNLNIDISHTYVCCYAKPKYYTINYAEDTLCLDDIWNHETLQESRRWSYEDQIDALCTTSCPVYKSNGHKFSPNLDAPVLEDQFMVKDL